MAENKKKIEPKTKVMVKTNSITPSLDGLRIELVAILITENLTDGQNRKIRFVGANSKILKSSRTNKNCRCRYTYILPLDRVKHVIDYNDGKIIITVEIISVDKKGNKKLIFTDHTVEIFLPAGGLKNECYTAIIRKWKYLGEWAKATIALTVLLAFLNHTGQTNNFFGFITALLVGLWVARKKKKINYIISVSFVLIIFFLCIFYPDVFTWPVRTGALLAYTFGIIFYTLEELFRKPNGKPYINFYPWFTLYIGAVVICFLILDVFAGFIPLGAEATGPLTDPVFLNPGWSNLNYLPFCENINFQQISWHIRLILSIGFAMFIQFIFGAPKEVIEWFKDRRERITAAATGGSTVTFAYLLKQFWQTIKRFFRTFGRNVT